MSAGRADAHAVRVSLAAAVDGVGPVIVQPDARGELAMADAERGVLRSGDGADPIAVLLLPPAPKLGLAAGIVRREVVVDGWRVEVDVEPAARAALRERASRAREAATHSGPAQVRAIIPGVVVAVTVAAGDAVAAGQKLLVVEAMKMQNELHAPRDGTVERVAVGPGAKIEVGDVLLVLS
ncbi:MAG TPA: biotin/lipoyl-containing protein [Candidatus Deferrimicrobiaceae bacterium]|nr:biotin/lipoyl-containing protein [Candidatus Deferrimicrobiaceae bacterium]